MIVANELTVVTNGWLAAAAAAADDAVAMLPVCRQMQPDFSAGHEHAASADDVTRVLRQIYVITLSLLQPGRQSSVVYTTPTFVALLPGCQTFLFA